MKGKIMSSSRFWITASLASAIGVLAVIPWSTQISIPSLMTVQQEQSLFAPLPARISQMNLENGAKVLEGEVLLQLSAPKLLQDLQLAEERKALLENRIDRTGSDDRDRASLIVLTNELESTREEIDGLIRIREQLTVRAPFDGLIADMDPELHVGLWVNPKTPLAALLAGNSPRIKGYVGEDNVFRFNRGTFARFVPDNPELPIVDTRVASIAVASSEQLDEPYLALPFGGSIAVEEKRKEELRPLDAAYAVALDPVDTSTVSLPQTAIRGVALIEGRPRSFYSRIKRQVMKVLVREIGV